MNSQRKRPIFHSEADFQHALAWEIHQQYQGCAIRLEYKPLTTNNTYIDIWVTYQNLAFAIELKYKTTALNTNFQNEDFHLSNQNARDQGRYDFLKDIQRLEQVIKVYNAIGYAIFLSNDSSYWNCSSNRSAHKSDLEFHIYQNRELTGTLKWGEKAGNGTKKERNAPIVLKSLYTLNWYDYSQLDRSQKNATFKTLLVKVEK
ncbi:hypothetical protein [Dictyobacter kobayashii]|uniref:Uncharacterized protein n=1 Tax=Dictyobacter kobayashii TaxID=2014872 RepID=A0A402ACF1_9CHLR|nr:hypothetical protein [Dictyobacter kobayashii]GCE16774.1 hypothetical protein KDK_05740 [Dictyobacter kobayashii]